MRTRNLFGTPAPARTLAAILSVGFTLSAPATTLVNLTMDGDGASDGDPLTYTINQGTLGGTATIAGTALDYHTSANGTLGALSDINGDSLGYTVPAGSVASNFTIMITVRVDNEQEQWDKIIKSDLFGDLSYQNEDAGEGTGISWRPQWWIGSKFHDFPVHTNGWHHYAMTYDHDGGIFSGTQRSLVTMYLDGVPVYTNNSHLQTSGFGIDQDVYVMGQQLGTRPIEGNMDNFQIHDTIRSDAEILAAAEAGLGSPPVAPELTTVENVNATMLEFDSELNAEYGLESSTNMVDWDSAGFIVIGNGGPMLVFDPTGTDTNKAYRLEVLGP